MEVEDRHVEFGNSVPSTAVQRVQGAACGWKIENGTLVTLIFFHQATSPVPELAFVGKLSWTLILGL